MTKSVIAAQLYTVRDFTQTTRDFAASMAKVSKIGYKAVQVSSIGPISDKEVKAITDGVLYTVDDDVTVGGGRTNDG